MRYGSKSESSHEGLLDKIPAAAGDRDRFDSRVMLLIIAIVLLLLWAGGLAFRVAGGFIHVLLVIGLIVIVLYFLRGG
jgi:hypothetical protein